mmetsp:Transcript_14289/g.39716  ORF Transcript_14289/g.39716 Transcript_14289/m.39716 type:complete len:195 (+) Transcript_14289:243-827(+)
MDKYRSTTLSQLSMESFRRRQVCILKLPELFNPKFPQIHEDRLQSCLCNYIDVAIEIESRISFSKRLMCYFTVFAIGGMVWTLVVVGRSSKSAIALCKLKVPIRRTKWCSERQKRSVVRSVFLFRSSSLLISLSSHIILSLAAQPNTLRTHTLQAASDGSDYEDKDETTANNEEEGSEEEEDMPLMKSPWHWMN